MIKNWFIRGEKKKNIFRKLSDEEKLLYQTEPLHNVNETDLSRSWKKKKKVNENAEFYESTQRIK